MREDESKAIADALERLTKLTVLLGTRDMKQTESVGILTKVGFTTRETAELLGSPEKKVRVIRANLGK